MANAPPPPDYYTDHRSRHLVHPAPTKSSLRSRRPRQKSPGTLERERLVLPRLPLVTPAYRPIRNWISTRIHKLLLSLIYLLWSIYLRLRWAYHAILNRAFSILYYHHRTPQLIQKDVKELKDKDKLPQHLSVVLEYEKGALDTLLDEVAEITAWCAAAGIPKLSVYEQTGILKSYISTSHRTISSRLQDYFGKCSPTLQVHTPHFTNDDGGIQNDFDDDDNNMLLSPTKKVDIEVVFISEEDGRESLVDLTKTLCDMAQRGKICSEDVSVELIDAEVKDNVIDEPELLILFGPSVCLRGYPPWQVRLTEIFHVQDNEGVGYQVFLRALHKFAKTEMRFGR